MKTEKFKGNLNGKKYTNEKEFFEAYTKMLKEQKPVTKMSYEHYTEDDGVTENQLDLFDGCTEKERKNKIKNNKEELIEAFDVKMPNFPAMVKDENLKDTFNQLISNLMSMYDELSVEEMFSRKEVENNYGDNIRQAVKYKEDILADKETIFKEITNLKEKITELNGKYDELSKLYNLCSRYLDYYDYLKFDTKGGTSYNSKEDDDLFDSFDNAMKVLNRIFSDLN